MQKKYIEMFIKKVKFIFVSIVRIEYSQSQDDCNNFSVFFFLFVME